MHLFISEFALSLGWHGKWKASEILWTHLPYPSGKEPAESTGSGGQHFEGDWANRLSITFDMTTLTCYYRLGRSKPRFLVWCEGQHQRHIAILWRAATCQIQSGAKQSNAIFLLFFYCEKAVQVQINLLVSLAAATGYNVEQCFLSTSVFFQAAPSRSCIAYLFIGKGS